MEDNIPNLPGYHITENGELYSHKSGVWKLRKGEISHPKKSKYPGRLQYFIQGKWYKASRLVALVYCPNPNNYPIVMHLDNNPNNNHYTNLKWGTYSMNNKQCSDEGRGIQYRLKGKLNPMYGVRGPLHPCYGKHLSETTKLKISLANKGKKLSQETRNKISLSGKLSRVGNRKLTKRRLRRIYVMRSKRKSQAYIARRVHLHQTSISKILSNQLKLD